KGARYNLWFKPNFLASFASIAAHFAITFGLVEHFSWLAIQLVRFWWAAKLIIGHALITPVVLFVASKANVTFIVVGFTRAVNFCRWPNKFLSIVTLVIGNSTLKYLCASKKTFRFKVMRRPF